MSTARNFRKALNSQRRAHQAKLYAGWVFDTETTLPDGRTLTQGDEFTVRGQGRFVFRHAVTNPAGEHWLDAFGGRGRTGTPSERREFRSFPADKVQTVHRAAILRTGRKES